MTRATEGAWCIEDPCQHDTAAMIELAADRTPFISQAQSINLFLPANVHKRDLHMLHYLAWKRGIKSLYYCRSKSLQRAETGGVNAEKTLATLEAAKAAMQEGETEAPSYDECLSCQ